jgi:hypothetical protein
MSYPDKRRLFFYGIHRSLSAPGNAPEKEYEKRKVFPFIYRPAMKYSSG